jgi:hypothetical protein
MSDAPKVRLSKVLGDLSGKLDRLKKSDADNVRKAFDAAVTASSGPEGKCDGARLFTELRGVLGALPDGTAQTAMEATLDRIFEERSFRGDVWLRDALLTTLREAVKLFAGG